MSSNNNNEIAISVRNVSKSYILSHQKEKQTTLAEAVLAKLRNPLQKVESETFWAVRDVSFDVMRGQVVGIIGRNGAGKSTMLKVLSRITMPTSGEIDVYGRIGSLLEVGTGFHPELTGRENIFLNGAILGMRRKEIDRAFDAIVDFAGVSKFLDTPVKRYSSGMYVRLAFSVAAHLEPEILVVDEVLAVGDSEFQEKCLGKMKNVADSGRTVLFVSHNMQAVSLLCTHGIFLERGSVTYSGTADGAIDKYMQSFINHSDTGIEPERRKGSGEYRVVAAKASKEYFAPEEPKTIRFTLEHRKPGNVGKLFVSAHVVDEMGAVIAQCDSRLNGMVLEDFDKKELEFTFAGPWLKGGRYHIDVFVCRFGGIIDEAERACTIHVAQTLPYGHNAALDSVRNGMVLGNFEWKAS